MDNLFKVFLKAVRVFSIIFETFLESCKSSQNQPKCEGGFFFQSTLLAWPIYKVLPK